MIIHTEAADIERKPDGNVEIRFLKESKITLSAIKEILDARVKLGGLGEYAVLVTLPEDIDFDINVLTNDHYQDRDLHKCTYAVAWEAESKMNEQLVEIFYRYFPQPFPVKVFRTEQEARDWLDTMHPKS
ncbi:MAG: hypothetical protein R2818_11010 [Flavobacteriales bacterium]